MDENAATEYKEAVHVLIAMCFRPEWCVALAAERSSFIVEVARLASILSEGIANDAD